MLGSNLVNKIFELKNETTQLCKDLEESIVEVEEESTYDDVFQRIEQIKIELEDLIEYHGLKEDNS